MAAHATAASVRDFKLFSYYFALFNFFFFRYMHVLLKFIILNVASFYVFHLYPFFLFTHIKFVYAFLKFVICF